MKSIFRKNLLDKDWPFFCTHINAITSTLRILFIFNFWWSAKLRVSDRAWVLKYELECDKVQWLRTHGGQALISLGKSLSKDMLFLCPQWSSGPSISTFPVQRKDIDVVEVRFTMRYSSRKWSNDKVITTACNFWRQIVCYFQVMSGNILFLGKKIFEIPPFFQTRPGDLFTGEKCLRMLY